jgi:hypothetical protein
MPWRVGSKGEDAYYCGKDEKLVIRDHNGKEWWFGSIYTPRELRSHFPHIFRDEVKKRGGVKIDNL